MTGRLKALDIERETKPGKCADGGLYLIVTGPTSKYWGLSLLEGRQGAMARPGLGTRSSG